MSFAIYWYNKTQKYRLELSYLFFFLFLFNTFKKAFYNKIYTSLAFIIDAANALNAFEKYIQLNANFSLKRYQY